MPKTPDVSDELAVAPPGQPEPEDTTTARFTVKSDRCTLGRQNSAVTAPISVQTKALVEAGHLEPTAKSTADALEQIEP